MDKYKAKEDKRQCLMCGTDISHRRINSIYCSDGCGEKHRNSLREHRCEECDGIFTGRKKKYCSKECSDEVRRRRNRERSRLENGLYEKYGGTKDCKMCGVKIEGKNITAVYCSRKCIETHHSRMRGHKPRDKYLEELRIKSAVNQEMKENERKKRLIETTRVRSCRTCGKSFKTTNSAKLNCSTTCSNKWRNRNKDKRINKSNLVDADITLEKLFKRDGGTCYICNGGCDFNDYHTTDSGHWYAGEKYPSIDHLLPLARDGKHAWDNIRLACKRCNTMKSDTLIENVLEHVPDNAYALKETKRGTPPKRTAQYDLSGNLIAVYESTGEASNKTNIKRKGIQKCARGECKTYKGFVWSYETTG